jgi:nitrous oxide reductase
MESAQVQRSFMNRRRMLTATAAVAATGVIAPRLGFARGAAAGSEATWITAADVNGATPYVISKPGYYLLAEDVGWTTSNPNAGPSISRRIT